MQNEKIKESKVTAKHVEKAVKPLTVEVKYTREEILASPSAFGVLPEVLAGALYLAEDEELSRNQVKKAINDFKNRKV